MKTKRQFILDTLLPYKQNPERLGQVHSKETIKWWNRKIKQLEDETNLKFPELYYEVQQL